MTVGKIVQQKVQMLFSGKEVSQALQILAEYQGSEQQRVQLAALKNSQGELERLRNEIAAATIDYRDVLAYAEYPRQMGVSGSELQSMPPRQRRALAKADGDEYAAWIRGEDLRPKKPS